MVRPELEQARVKLYEKKDRTRIVVMAGGGLFVVLFPMAVFNLIDCLNFASRGVGPAERLSAGQLSLQRFLTWFTLAVVALIGPYGFFLGKKQRNIKAVERRVPDFLRDVAEAGRVGMAPAGALVVSSRGRGG